MANYRVTAETGRILPFCFCNEDTGEINITKVPQLSKPYLKPRRAVIKLEASLSARS
jgi:hypothetical protein